MELWEIGVALIVINLMHLIYAYLQGPLTWDFFLGGVVVGAAWIGFYIAYSYFSGGANNG